MMRSNNIKRFIFFSLFIAVIFSLAACGNETSESETNESDSNVQATTIESGMGEEFTIPTDVERVLAPFHEDGLLAIGVTPVAKWAIGETLQEHLEDQLADVPKIEWTLPLEQVLSFEPDLIILESNLDSYEGTYEEYNKIAPTYVMTEETTLDWRKQIDTFGTLLGMQDEAEAALTGYEEKVEDASAELTEALGEETVAAIWVIGGKFFTFEKDRHSAKVMYDELGVQVPSLINDLGEAPATWDALSLEKLSELDADHVILLAAEGEEGLETLENSEVWKSIPAEQNGNVHVLPSAGSWTNTGLHASQQTIDALLDIFVK